MGLFAIILKKLDKITKTKGYQNKIYKHILPHVELIKNEKVTSINLVGVSQTRGEATAKMLLNCLKDIRTDKNFHFRFFINDKPKKGYEKGCFYYCINDDTKFNSLIPDFAFESWREAGINSFTSTAKQIEKQGKENWTDSRLFWIGNVKTNKIRLKLLELYQEKPDIFHFQDTFVNNFTIHKKDVPYLSLPDHTKYKYLLDVEGNSYSARLKFLFYSQRVVFIQDRSWKEYFQYDLIPYEHFIPVKNDLSDLYSQYQRIEKDPLLYRKIVKNALSFAHTHLTYETAIAFMTNAIN